MSFLTYDTADDIISSLEIIEKLLFPETDFWHDNYLKKENEFFNLISYKLEIVNMRDLRNSKFWNLQDEKFNEPDFQIF